MARLLFEQLVQQGNAEWEGADKTRCLIIWRTVDEWANLIYTWVQESGLAGSVLTLYELLHGEDSAGAAFHDLDPAVLRKALAVLEKRGKAQMFAGSTPDAEGVKFFA